MFQCEGIYLPDGERHLVGQLRDKRRNPTIDGKGSYQARKLERALKRVRDWRTALDVGAHVGLWSMQLVKRFRLVEAFEPLAAHRACFLRNVPMEKVILHACALGEAEGCVAMRTAPGSSGDSRVAGSPDGPGGAIPLRRLDAIMEGVDDVDFLKLDCEGYELFVLRGGEELLRRCRPVVVVEQKPGKAQAFGLGERAAVAYLQGLGAELRDEIAGDYVLSWD